MIIHAPENLRSQTLLRSFKSESYGNKFIKFSEEIAKLFDKVIKIDFQHKKNQKDKDAINRSVAILIAVMLRKIYKKQFENYQPQQFLQLLKNKCTQICILTKRSQEAAYNIINPIIGAINNIQLLNSCKDIGFFLELIKGVVNKKQITLSEQELNLLKGFFKQSICFLNYDENKEAFQNIEINSRTVYLLKAKQQYFILLKNPEIIISSEAYISFNQLMSIFNMQTTVQAYEEKKTIEESLRTSQSKIKKEIQQNIGNDQSRMIKNDNISNKLNLPKSSIKQSILFPDSVKCSICSRNISQFNALFWNYSYVCFQCIVVPHIDVSFIPWGLIQKFLRTHKYQTKQYHIICPECKSQTFLSNYKPWQKPKRYTCKVCQKVICIQHEAHVNSCYCYCSPCDRQTITISKLFLKYCLVCRNRNCQICNVKGRAQCQCICKICGENQKVQHYQCKVRCHCCLNVGDGFTACICGKKLCGMCLFKSFDPTSKICLAQNNP